MIVDVLELAQIKLKAGIWWELGSVPTHTWEHHQLLMQSALPTRRWRRRISQIACFYAALT